MFTLKGHTGWVLAVSYSPDDEVIATGSMDKTVRVWNAKTGKPMGGPMKGHTKSIRALCWEPFHFQKPGERRVASASEDTTVRIWSANQQKIDMVLSGHAGKVSCVKWGGAGFIYTSSHDKTVKICKSSFPSKRGNWLGDFRECERWYPCTYPCSPCALGESPSFVNRFCPQNRRKSLSSSKILCLTWWSHSTLITLAKPQRHSKRRSRKQRRDFLMLLQSKEK